MNPGVVGLTLSPHITYILRPLSETTGAAIISGRDQQTVTQNIKTQVRVAMSHCALAPQSLGVGFA